MEHAYTDYLFILAIYSDSIPLGKLLFHTEPGGKATPKARADAGDTLDEMERKGLVALTRKEDDLYVRLTALGRRVSDGVAGVVADSMVTSWRAQQLEFPAHGAAG